MEDGGVRECGDVAWGLIGVVLHDMNCSEARAVSLGTQIAEMDMIPKFKQTQGWNTYLSFEFRREDARDHIRQWTSRLNTPPSLPLTISSRLTFEFPP